MVDRARLAATRWIPYSSAGAAVSLVAGFLLGLPPIQVIVSTALTATLIFSGLFFQSYGREEKGQEVRQ
ncbi:MAG: hypothetical protein HRF40_01840 [Nitrososphaera sp.]|jgi:hypothetical protein